MKKTVVVSIHHKIKLLPAVRIRISDIRNRFSAQIAKIVNAGKNFVIRASLVPINQESRMSTLIRSFSLARKMELERRRQSLITITYNSLSNTATKLEKSNNILNILSPENVLKRGFTLTSLNGVIIKNCNQLKTDDLIDTLFSDGSVRSRVLEEDK